MFKNISGAGFATTFVSLLLASSAVLAQDKPQSSNQSPDSKITEEVVVTGLRQRLQQAGALANTISKTEVIGVSSIEHKNAVNLSEAIDNSPGVRVSNDCSMCGFKRIMLNGLRGDQTTILVDGLPTHTLISGYYAVDAIPTTGVDRIEVARGAGASLIAPEAIGGTVNIVTTEAEDNRMLLDLSAGENGYQKVGFLGTAISDDSATRLTLISQFDSRDQFDADNNKVSETPFMENKSLIARISHDVTERDNVTFRYANISSDVFGGPVLGERFADGKASSSGAVLSRYDGAGSDTQDLFVGGDVDNDFSGKAWETAEWVNTQRNEASLSWLRELNADWNMRLASSWAQHEQDSFYEGFDYFAEDTMLFVDAKFNWIASDAHLLTFGLDSRTETMRSDSYAGSLSADYVSDSFDYDVLGLYLQDTWQATDNLDIAMALRVDQIEADFIDPSKPGTEINETIVSPRVDIRYMHTDRWTSRLSAGRGYRAPLSFFETDHGILDSGAGFEVDVDKLERSVSTTYALSFEGEQLTSTLSFAYTEVDNLASLEETATAVPVLTQLDDSADVATVDLALNYQFTDAFNASMIIEAYDYDDNFKTSYTSAPIEQRITLSFDYDINDWELVANLVWFGSRDLGDFGYDGYNRVDSSGNVVADSKKTLDAPAFFTVDFKVQKQLNEHLSVYAGASNLLDYSQAGNEESPLMFESDEGAGAYDVAYIYGPLRGREAYLGVKLEY
jgi:outer membrane receptor for ferrienterochelin and colicin